MTRQTLEGSNFGSRHCCRVDIKLEWVTTRVRPRQAERQPGKAVQPDVRPHVRPHVRPDASGRTHGRTSGRTSGRKSGGTPGLALAWRGRTLVLRTLVIWLPEFSCSRITLTKSRDQKRSILRKSRDQKRRILRKSRDQKRRILRKSRDQNCFDDKVLYPKKDQTSF